MTDFNWIDAAAIEDLNENEVLGITLNLPAGKDCELALYRVAGKVYATEGICTHAHAHLSKGSFDEHVIECPIHGGAFDIRTGAPVRAPAKRPLLCYRTCEKDGRIWVQMA